MFRKRLSNVSPKGERFEHFGCIESVVTPSISPSEKCFTDEGETLRERFKSHKSMQNNIHIKNNNNLSPIHPTPARAARYACARIYRGVKGKDSIPNGSSAIKKKTNACGNNRRVRQSWFPCK